MTHTWPEVQLGELLAERIETPDEAAIASGSQPIISKIRFSDGGIEFRANGESKTQLISIHPGDLVLSGINAMKGAIALYDNDDRKAAATIHYSAYRINRHKVVDRFLWMYLRHEVFQEILTRHVPAGIKTELKAERFLPLPVPMPSVSEQQAIIGCVDEIADRLAKASRLHAECCDEAERLLARVITERTSSLEVVGKLKDVLTGKPRNGWSAKCDNDPNGTAILTLTAVRGFEYRPGAIKRTSLPTTKGAHYWLTEGDVLITRSNSIELVGHAAIYDGRPLPCIYPDLMMRLPIESNRVLAEFLIFWLQSSLVRDYIRANAKGTSPSMKKINQGVVMNIPFPTGLSVAEQRRLITEFQEYVVRLRSLRVVHEQAAVDLNAMLPAVLGRAFRGELVEAPHD
jgi:type I restriction enzyme S subunit